jgi:hypothetical protein
VSLIECPACGAQYPKGTMWCQKGHSLIDAKAVLPAEATTTPVTSSVALRSALTIDDWSAAVDGALSVNPADVDSDVLGHLLYIIRLMSAKFSSDLAEEVRRVLGTDGDRWLQLRELQYLLDPNRPLTLKGQPVGQTPKEVAAWAAGGDPGAELLVSALAGGHLTAWLRQRGSLSLCELCEGMRTVLKQQSRAATSQQLIVLLLENSD